MTTFKVGDMVRPAESWSAPDDEPDEAVRREAYVAAFRAYPEDVGVVERVGAGRRRGGVPVQKLDVRWLRTGKIDTGDAHYYDKVNTDDEI